MTNGNGTHTEVAPEFLKMIQVTDLDTLLQAWPFVKAGIERIRARDKSCGSWTHSQIFNAIKFGLPTAPQRTTGVELFLAIDSQKRIKAFMVTTPKLDPFRNNAPVGVIVWLLYANYAMIEQFLPELERLGKINGGDQIEFQSGRQGWLRHFGRMMKLGFRIEQYKFIKDIQW